MRVQDIMSKAVITISKETPVRAARERLQMGEVEHLVVVDDHRPAGIVTAKELAGNDDAPVSTVMSRPVATIAPDETLRRAAGIMRGRAVGCLPVVDHDKLVGIVTTSDLLTALAKGGTHTTPPRERAILRKGAPRKRGAPI